MIFHIPAKMIAKARPRFSQGHTYTPEKTKNAEIWIATWVTTKMERVDRSVVPLKCPVSVEIVFHVQPPKSWSKKRAEVCIGEPHTQKPDADNCTKLILDSLNGIVWIDDSQVWNLKAKKMWAREDLIELNVNW